MINRLKKWWFRFRNGEKEFYKKYGIRAEFESYGMRFITYSYEGRIVLKELQETEKFDWQTFQQAAYDAYKRSVENMSKAHKALIKLHYEQENRNES